MRLTWLADVLRAAGLNVVEVDGWKTRGVDYSSTPLGVICHETQGSATSTDKGEINVLINGRTGLPGPIAQLYLSRSGTWHVVASGRCNQVKTGWGGPLSGKGNSYSFGVEAQHAVSEDWARKPVQYDAYVRGVAAICARMKWQPDGHVIGHKEHQPGDKSDPEFSMPAFRTAVAATTAGGTMDATLSRGTRTKPATVGDRGPGTQLDDVWGQEQNEQSPYDGATSKRTQRLIRIETKLDQLLARPAGGDVDEAALARELAPLIEAGASPEEIAAAVRTMLADALAPAGG